MLKSLYLCNVWYFNIILFRFFDRSKTYNSRWAHMKNWL